MAYNGNDSLERELYNKYIKAGFTDEEANSLAKIEKKLSTTLGGIIREPTLSEKIKIGLGKIFG